MKLSRFSGGLSRPALVLLLAVLVLLLAGAGDDDARFDKLGHQMMCVCGCNQVLLECNHVGCEYSQRMRDELAAGLQRGDNDSLILQSFVQKYGPTVLAAPTTTGFNRIAWIMPFVVLVLGIALVIVVVRLWRLRVQPLPVASGLAPAQLDELRRRARQETEI